MSEKLGGINDRQFNSFGGQDKPTTFRRVQDPHLNKLIQLKEIELSGINVNCLPILKNNRGRYLTTNNGSLLFRE